jgi:predicted DNA-binding transcriptional regulator AlpA
MPKPKIPDDERLGVSVVQAMQITGLCRASIYKLLHSGQLQSTKILDRRVILRRSLMALLEPR